MLCRGMPRRAVSRHAMQRAAVPTRALHPAHGPPTHPSAPSPTAVPPGPGGGTPPDTAQPGRPARQQARCRLRAAPRQAALQAQGGAAQAAQHQ